MRAQGYQTMLERYSDWEMVAQQTGDNSREEAEKVMKLFLEQEPDLRVVFAESDEMALGAIDAIREIRKDLWRGRRYYCDFIWWKQSGDRSCKRR